jgi:tripartite-type tricarboxylate transporter receptor subunit TctC
MTFPRRRFLQVAAGAAALPVVSRFAYAQTYPSRPVRLIVGYPAGGPADIGSRLIAQALSDRLGQPFVVENRPGAGGNIGTEVVVKAVPDGYTLLNANILHAINTTLYENLSFNFIRDIAGVALIYRQPLVLEVHPSLPVKTVPEFIAYAKANPGTINIASSGIGTPQHLALELFKRMAVVDLIHVPYRGSAPALTDLISGQVQVMIDTINSSIGHIRTGRLRALAVSMTTRSQALPDVPTVAEFVRGFEVTSWSGVGVPKKTPPEIIAKLNTEINAALAEPKFKERFAELGAIVTPVSSAEFDKFIAAETEKWGNVIRGANIRAE